MTMADRTNGNMPTPAVGERDHRAAGGRIPALAAAALCLAVLFTIINWRSEQLPAAALTQAASQQQPSAAMAVRLPANVLTSTPASIKLYPVRYRAEQLWQGRMLLVDDDHPVPEQAAAPNTHAVSQAGQRRIPYLDPGIQSGLDTIEALAEMIAALNKIGCYNLTVSLGTLSRGEQTELQMRYMTQFAAQHTLEEAVALTREHAADPGCSEHQLPWAVDLFFSAGYDKAPGGVSLEETQAGRWLVDQCWKYGFIRRYPQGLASREGEAHFRYVGRLHSEMMHVLKLDFEEYLDLLREQDTLCLMEDGAPKYLIYTCLTRGDITTRAPSAFRQVEVSMDNRGGAIVAYTLR